jgi:hypothetical protein
MPRKPAAAPVSLDQAIKELLQLRPADTLDFLLPEVAQARGAPVSWQFHNVQVRKKDLSRKGLVMDLNVEYRFRDGAPLLLVLVEHWSTARSVDLLRTAQYFLDLASRFPEHEIVPIALVTEPDDRRVPESFVRLALGEEVLRFRTRVVQLSRTQADQWIHARNLVAVTLLMAMGGPPSRPDRLQATLEFLVHHDEDETRLLFPLFVQVGRLSDEEHAMTIKYLTKLPKPLFMEIMEAQANERGLATGMANGIAEGVKQKAIEDARKMREHGISWDIVTDVTGVKPEDLQVG